MSNGKYLKKTKQKPTKEKEKKNNLINKKKKKLNKGSFY